MSAVGATSNKFDRCRSFRPHSLNIVYITALTDCPVRCRSFRASSITCFILPDHGKQGIIETAVSFVFPCSIRFQHVTFILCVSEPLRSDPHSESLSPPIVAHSASLPEWDLNGTCNGLARELRVKSEKFELVPLAMGRAPNGILRIFSARGL